MILDPELIIADEPVSMLDASVRVSILDLLRQIQTDRRVAFLYITHDLATARHFANRIAVMYAGKLAELGPVGSVLAEPLHPYTQALMAAIPDPDPENRAGPGADSAEVVPPETVVDTRGRVTTSASAVRHTSARIGPARGVERCAKMLSFPRTACASVRELCERCGRFEECLGSEQSLYRHTRFPLIGFGRGGSAFEY